MKIQVNRSREEVDDKGILIECPRARHPLGFYSNLTLSHVLSFYRGRKLRLRGVY